MAMLLEWVAVLMRRLWEVRTSGARRGGEPQRDQVEEVERGREVGSDG
jgi:hypothetical protein